MEGGTGARRNHNREEASHRITGLWGGKTAPSRATDVLLSLKVGAFLTASIAICDSSDDAATASRASFPKAAPSACDPPPNRRMSVRLTWRRTEAGPHNIPPKRQGGVRGGRVGVGRQGRWRRQEHRGGRSGFSPCLRTPAAAQGRPQTLLSIRLSRCRRCDVSTSGNKGCTRALRIHSHQNRRVEFGGRVLRVVVDADGWDFSLSVRRGTLNGNERGCEGGGRAGGAPVRRGTSSIPPLSATTSSLLRRDRGIL